jgi:NAD(P)-dependent dehydrogenase (short-subunit alcohol dehydrogenase family)
LSKILVTGGAGFIGSNFVRLLLQASDHRLVNVDALTYAGNLENLADVERHERYAFVKADIADAARKLAQAAAEGRLDPATITEAVFAGSLSTAGLPPPDLIVRPSGEQRLSNFLLWEAAYAELVFQDILWPDYDAASLADAITAFRSRDRRFGGAVSDDVRVAG